jgi:thioesterase domain-containing protein
LKARPPFTGVTPGAGALFGRTSGNSERVIVPINDSALSGDARGPAFYCVHSAPGVAGTDFLALAQRLGPAIRFYGLQAPASRMLDASFGSSVDSIADYYVDALGRFQPAGPLVLGGHCLGAVIALAMAQRLRARGRQVGPLLAIDGAPENTGAALPYWSPRYWLDLARNLPRWVIHGDLTRNRGPRSLAWSLKKGLKKRAHRIGRAAMGLKRGAVRGGGYSIEGVMDLSPYEPAHRVFINRLYGAVLTYVAGEYPGEVVAYVAQVTPLMYSPQIGRSWRRLAPQTEVLEIPGTHVGMMREPYVEALARDMRARIESFCSKPG